VIIFDCIGVLVDSEPIAAAVAAEEFTRVGIPLTPELVLRFFFSRRPADMIAMVEAAGKCKLPPSFASRLTAAIVARLRADLRAVPHAAYALTWLAQNASRPHQRDWRASSITCFPQPTSPTASLRPTCSCMPQRAWALSRATASWSKIPLRE
jgi:beta-phosphoglucomutase-like phosphatase (HAD superfamily)